MQSSTTPDLIDDLFDYDQMDAIMDDNSEEVREILQDFLVDMEKRLPTLQANAQSGRHSATASEAHQLRGMAASFGLRAVAETALRLEDAAKAQRPLQTALADELVKTCQSSVIALRQARPAFFL